MSLPQHQIALLERQYGSPDEISTVQKMTPAEISALKAGMKDGRADDVTLFIAKDDGYIFIAKPFYPVGLFRAPSGGIRPGEDIVAGAKREAQEETGVDIELEKYILRIFVRFQSGDDAVDWISHIFKAKYTAGRIRPLDKQEIKEARLVKLHEIPRFRELMLSSNSAGLAYRAFLTDEAIKRL